MSYLLTLAFVVTSIIAIIFLTAKFKLNSFIALFIVSLFLAFVTLAPEDIIANIQEGFGKTMGSIGFLVILGAIIGITLDKTGAMISIAKFVIDKIGTENSTAAIGITGFIVGIPIFCDSGYIIMSSLAKSFSYKAKIPMVFMATVLAASLYSVHCLIPTHPGVLAGAQILNADIGNLITLGIVFALPGAVCAYFWSKFMTMRPGKNYPVFAQVVDDYKLNKGELPSVFLSLAPIIFPLLLIIISSLLRLIDSNNSFLLTRGLILAGNPVFALLIGAVIAVFLLKNRKVTTLNEIFNEALEKAGPILIITAAGGAFGMIITATGLGEETGKLLAGTSLGLVVPFLIASFLKTAQGSSTVAIITAAAFLSPMLNTLGLDSEWGRIFSMLSIGAGSMIFSHANDSYFWVVSKFSNINEGTTLRIYSSTTFLMGVSIFITIWIVSIFVI